MRRNRLKSVMHWQNIARNSMSDMRDEGNLSGFYVV